MKRKKVTARIGFRVILQGTKSQAAEMVLAPGATEGGPENRHRGSDQWMYVVAGSGHAIVNRRKIALTPGTLVLIEHGDTHEIRNTGKTTLRTLNFYVPKAYSKRGDTLPPGRP